MYRMTIALVTGIVLIAGLTVVRAQEKKEGDEARFAEMDKGPAKIDVSKYPEEMKDFYKLFKDRCAKCHTIARPINSSFALPDEWERYIKRMMRKPGSGISAEDGKKIFEFLKYDSSMRKKSLIERKLKEQQKESAK